MFRDLCAPVPDPILGMAKLFSADASPEKVDLGIGVYSDEAGDIPVLATVKEAERILLENQPSKTYLSSAGNPSFNDAVRALAMGDSKNLVGRTRTIQTPGGTGALKLAADFIRFHSTQARIFIPMPTWANHNALFSRAGLEPVHYRYYDANTGDVAFEAMIEDLTTVKPGDVVLLHGCCHNPTGADLTLEEWSYLGAFLEARSAMPLVDLAYLGFSQGIAQDAGGLRLLAETVPEMMVASSCSKNFALYRERVGALSLVGASNADAERAHAHALVQARTNWSMPPDHGAAVVALILDTPSLRVRWEAELTNMRSRIDTVRVLFAARLSTLSGRDFSFIARQRGMFTQLTLSAKAVEQLRVIHHVHATKSGRINVAGMSTANVDWVSEAVAQVLTV